MARDDKKEDKQSEQSGSEKTDADQSPTEQETIAAATAMARLSPTVYAMRSLTEEQLAMSAVVCRAGGVPEGCCRVDVPSEMLLVDYGAPVTLDAEVAQATVGNSNRETTEQKKAAILRRASFIVDYRTGRVGLHRFNDVVYDPRFLEELLRMRDSDELCQKLGVKLVTTTPPSLDETTEH